MKLISRSVLGSILSPKKGKDKGTSKDQSAPSAPAIGKDIPTPSVPGIGSNLPIPSVTDLDKDLPTPSAAGAAKDTPAPSVAGPDSKTDGNASPSTITTSITVSVIDTSTVTSADVTVTIVQHDLATVATTAPTTVTVIHHDSSTEATTVPTTIVTTALMTPSIKPIATAYTTTALQPAVSAIPTAKTHTEPAVIVSIVFGLITMVLLGVICFLVMKLRRTTKAKTTVGMKTYAEEFDWPQPRPIEMDDIQRKDEWGPKQKEAWGVA